MNRFLRTAYETTPGERSMSRTQSEGTANQRSERASQRRLRTVETPLEPNTAPGAVRRNGEGHLDEGDRIIVEALAEDGRASNRALATATGLTEGCASVPVRRCRGAAAGR